MSDEAETFWVAVLCVSILAAMLLFSAHLDRACSRKECPEGMAPQQMYYDGCLCVVEPQ